MAKSILLVVLLAIAMTWWLWPQPVDLSASQYDTAVALYRVCNQKSVKGIEKIEELIENSRRNGPTSEISPLDSIIESAKSGDWESASRGCRRLLEKQVKR